MDGIELYRNFPYNDVRPQPVYTDIISPNYVNGGDENMIRAMRAAPVPVAGFTNTPAQAITTMEPALAEKSVSVSNSGVSYAQIFIFIVLLVCGAAIYMIFHTHSLVKQLATMLSEHARMSGTAHTSMQPPGLSAS
jgi:hypothetical protein